MMVRVVGEKVNGIKGNKIKKMSKNGKINFFFY